MHADARRPAQSVPYPDGVVSHAGAFANRPVQDQLLLGRARYQRAGLGALGNSLERKKNKDRNRVIKGEATTACAFVHACPTDAARRSANATKHFMTIP